MKKGCLIVLGIVAAVVVLALIVIGVVKKGYDTAVSKSEAVKGAWAQIDTQLQRRYDLIPNLVETVKGYAKHEQELFTHLADARKAYFAAGSVGEKAKAATRMESAISRLLLLTENYPELKASENFMKLHDSLEGTENRIAVARTRYNDAVKDLNTYVRTFFGRFFAALARVEKGEYFEIGEKAKEAPKVEFSGRSHRPHLHVGFWYDSPSPSATG